MRPELDYYAILQVDPHAEQEVIQAAYRRLAAKYHPDVDPSPGASETMKLLNAAYEILSDPEKRRAYDLSRAREWRQQTAEKAPTGQRPWWALPLGIVILVLALRINPRLALIVALLMLALWLFWRPGQKK